MASKSNPTFGTITRYKLGSVSFFCGTILTRLKASGGHDFNAKPETMKEDRWNQLGRNVGL